MADNWLMQCGLVAKKKKKKKKIGSFVQGYVFGRFQRAHFAHPCAQD